MCMYIHVCTIQYVCIHIFLHTWRREGGAKEVGRFRRRDGEPARDRQRKTDKERERERERHRERERETYREEGMEGGGESEGGRGR